MRIWMALLAELLIASIAAGGQDDVKVTFYSSGNLWTTGTPYANHAAFIGSLYDGNRRIGFVQPKHFLTMRFSPGAHTFSASMSTKHPAENSQLELKLAEGTNYFVRVLEISRGVMVVGSEKGSLESVPCEVAHQDAENAGPTNLKHISPEMRNKVTLEKAMPPCN